MSDLLLYSKIETLPEDMKAEVLDFIDFLISKTKHGDDNKPKPKFGSGKGMFKMSPDFDDPLEDFKEYM